MAARSEFTGIACTICRARGPPTTRHREAEGSSYYRHFYMGLLRADGTPKLALRDLSKYAPEFGICQWFHDAQIRAKKGMVMAALAQRH